MNPTYPLVCAETLKKVVKTLEADPQNGSFVLEIHLHAGKVTRIATPCSESTKPEERTK